MKHLQNFKSFKKHGKNLLNNSRFTYYVFKNFKKPKWSVFRQDVSERSHNNYINVGYNTSLYVINQNLNIVLNPHYKIVSGITLLKSLVDTHFIRTFKESAFLIRSGFIFVNGVRVTNPTFLIRSSDIVSFSKCKERVWINSYFFTNFKTVFTNYKIPQSFEASYSCSFYVFCYLASSSMVEPFSYTKVVIGSNPMVLILKFFLGGKVASIGKVLVSKTKS